MSRPEKPINWERVDELLTYGCEGTEIAAVFDVHPQTFYNRVVDRYKLGFTEYRAQKKAIGEALIRETQFRKAVGDTKKGDNTLLIWLGKQRLGQKENSAEQILQDEIVKPFNELMGQIKSLQEARKTEDNNASTDTNSACVTAD